MSNYTPLSHLTDDELLQKVCSVEHPTDLELELATRLAGANDYIASMEGCGYDEGYTDGLAAGVISKARVGS